MSDTMLRITGVRVVRTRPRDPLPPYEPAPGSWSTGHVEVANPVSLYPEYKPMRSLFMPDPGGVDSFQVEVATDQGVTGYGCRRPGRRPHRRRPPDASCCWARTRSTGSGSGTCCGAPPCTTAAPGWW